MIDLAHYGELLGSITVRVRQAQIQAMLSVNAEMLRLYWEIGGMIAERQQQEGWGAGVIPRLARDLHNELPEVKGFSERNIKRMLAFHRAYPVRPDRPAIVPQPVAQLDESEQASLPAAEIHTIDSLLWNVPWGHHAILMEQVKDQAIRLWYMQQVVMYGWSRETLASMIKRHAHLRQGKAVTNFAVRLPLPQSELAAEALKDPYIFDFLTLQEPFHERELETGLVRHIEKFLLELGQGFAFAGRQYHLNVGEDDFYIDLLFYHLRLRCFVVIDLKRGKFKPEFAGKMNFYCSVVDDVLKHTTDQPTIGLILCQTKDRIVAEYALRDINKPIGVADYEFTRALPAELASSLPSIEEIEAELQTNLEASNDES